MNTNKTTSSNESWNNSGKNPCKKLVNILAVVGVMQQPTTEANEGHQPTALSFLPNSRASVSSFPWDSHPTRLPRASTNSRSSLGIVALPGVCQMQGATERQSNHMIITIKNSSKSKQSTLTPEGIYAAVVHKVTDKSNAETGKPAAVEIEYALEGVTDPIKRTYPADVDGRSPLKRDAKTLRGHGFTHDEVLQSSFNPAVLTGLRCRVVVAHRADGSGKLTAQAKLVLAPEASPAVAATVA